MENCKYILNLFISKKSYGSLIKDHLFGSVFTNQDELNYVINDFIRSACFDEFATREINTIGIEKFNNKYNYCIEVISINTEYISITEYDCLLNPISINKLPNKFNKYLYYLNTTVFELNDSNETIGFLSINNIRGIYYSEKEAIDEALVFTNNLKKAYKNMNIGCNDHDLYKYLNDIAFENIITKIPIEYNGVNVCDNDGLSIYKTTLNSFDRSSMTNDELYDEMMKFVIAEIRYYDIDCNFTGGMWMIGDSDEFLYKSYEDFITNKPNTFNIGDIVSISDYIFQSYSNCISNKLIGDEEYDSLNGIYVVEFTYETGVIDSEDPMFWCRGVTLEGVGYDYKYKFYNDFVNDRYCVKYNEELPKDSFISLIQQAIIEGKFTRENIVEILEDNDIITGMEYKDTLYYKDIPLFKEFLRNSDI